MENVAYKTPASNLRPKSTVKCTYVKMGTEGFIMGQINWGSRPYNLVLHFSGCFLRAELLIIGSYCLQQETDSQISLCMSFFLTHSVPAFNLALYWPYSFSALPSTVVPRTSGRFLSPQYVCNDSDASVTSTSSCSIAMSIWMCGSG